MQTLTFDFGVLYVQADSATVVNVPHPHTLYGVMKAYADEGTYAKNHRYENTHIIALTNTKCAGDLWLCCRLS